MADTSELEVFKDSYSAGFHMTFSNGWKASVQFGSTNYCANRRAEILPSSCPNAEVLAWKGDKDYPEDGPRGWLSTNEVLAFMNEVAALPA